MRFLLVCLIMSSCALSTKPEKKWSDSYDPAQWRARYEICKEIIDTDLWTQCMGTFEV